MTRSTVPFHCTTGWQLESRFHHCLLIQCGGYGQSEWLYDCWHHNGHQVRFSATHPTSFMIARDKFSASNYWKDCVKYKVSRFSTYSFGLRVNLKKVTAAQYIGEICRYLINSPPCPEEKTHQVRLMFGNGLRPDIWTQFVSRWRQSMVAIYLPFQVWNPGHL